MKRLLVALAFFALANNAPAQVDVQHRRTLTLQTGFSVSEGEERPGGFGFYWFNENHFPWTNTALRVIFAGVLLDAELSCFLPGNTHTAIGVGLGGGAFVDSITPYVKGERLARQEFYGDNANLRLFINHEIPNPTPLALNIRGTYIARGSFYRPTSHTSDFTLPQDFFTQTLLAELRFGAIQPGLTARRGLQLYIAAEANYRSGFDAFGPDAALFAAHSTYQRLSGSLAAKIPVESTTLFARVGGGLGDGIDQLSAWKLGGNLAGAEPFAYTLHGYYTREIFAEDFCIANLSVSQQLTDWRELTLHLYGDYAAARTVPPQDGQWHSFFGVGTGVGFRAFWDVQMLVNYGYGINAVRNGQRGGHEVGLAIEKKF